MLIPLPFVATLLLCILLYRLIRDSWAFANNRLFIALIAIYTFGTFLMGLRWSYGITEAAYVMAIVGASVPIVAWLSFRSLTRAGPELHWRRDARHLIPLVVLVAMMLLLPAAIDACILVIYGIYCAALARLAQRGPEQLKLAKFEHLRSAHQALWATTAALVLFALLDLLIMADFELNQGRHAPTIVNAVYIPMVFLLSFFTAAVSQSRSVEPQQKQATNAEPIKPKQSNAAAATTAAELDETQRQAAQQIMRCLESLMNDQHLYRDENLNLATLARKCGRPSREVSAAVNQLKGINISQYVNAYRVKELGQLLRQTDKSITELQLAVGFQTRSNCIREFKRINGCSPTQWREAAEQKP